MKAGSNKYKSLNERVQGLRGMCVSRTDTYPYMVLRSPDQVLALGSRVPSVNKTRDWIGADESYGWLGRQVAGGCPLNIYTSRCTQSV